MIRLTQYRRQVVCMLFLACSLSAAYGAVAEPTDWPMPARRPEIREMIKGKVYEQMMERVLKAINIPALEMDKKPALYGEVVEVAPGSAAESLGIKPGHLITSWNKALLWSSVWPEDPARELTVLDKVGGQERTINPPAGGLGINAAAMWAPQLHYLRKGQRSAKWDKEVVVGIAGRYVLPKLAETAWFHALAAGYQPDSMLDTCAADFSFEQQRGEVSRDFAAFARLANPDKGDWADPRIIARAALGNFKLPDLLDVISREPYSFERRFAADEP